jgi:hypothetical protein
MTPAVRHGDVVHVAPASVISPGPGCVVCYEPVPGTLALHRVVRRSARGLQVRGDMLAYRETIEADQILGTLVAIERDGRIVRRDTRSSRLTGRLAVFAAPVLRLGAGVVWRLGAARASIRGA